MSSCPFKISEKILNCIIEGNRKNFMNYKVTNEQEFREYLVNNKEKYFKVKVIPSSLETAFKGEMADGTLKIAVAAPPEKNHANQALLIFLAKILKIEVNRLKIVSGANARRKLIKVVSKD